MLDSSIILSLVRKYTNSNNEIEEDTFFDLVNGLEESEVEMVLDILKSNHISVAEEVECVSVELKNGSKLQMLSNEELCVLYQRGSSAALEALCLNNKRLVHKIALRVLREYKPEVLTEEDLYIEGNLGIINAANKFKAEMGNKFTTYACWWIRQAITREVINNGYGMRLPVHIFEQVVLVNKCRKAIKSGSIELIRDMLLTDFGKEYSLENVSKLVSYADYYLNTSSLNKIVGEDDGDTELMDFVKSEISVEDEAIDSVVRDDIDAVLSTLSEKEKNVIELRFGLSGNNSMTLEQIAKIYNVTRERIRQIEAKALKKLAQPSRIQRLEGMLVA